MLKELYNKLNTEKFNGGLPDIRVIWMDVATHRIIANKIKLPDEKVLFGYYQPPNLILINKIIHDDKELVELVLLHEMNHVKTHLDNITKSDMCFATGELFNKLMKYKLKFLRMYG
jgi:Zn-dependent peptidase ImmA (M78 family)